MVFGFNFNVWGALHLDMNGSSAPESIVNFLTKELEACALHISTEGFRVLKTETTDHSSRFEILYFGFVLDAISNNLIIEVLDYDHLTFHILYDENKFCR